MDWFAETLLQTLRDGGAAVHAWCVLPNHYHALVRTKDLPALFRELGRFHGRTSRMWNEEENSEGRQVFCRAAERAIRSERHFWATVNYVHNNPVHHSYVKLWPEWPWSSATSFLEKVGREEAVRIWTGYPLKDYGAKWDSSDL